VVPERELVAEALRRGIGRVTLDGIEEQLDHPDLLKATYEGQLMVTTRQVLDEEQELIAIVRKGRGCRRSIVKNELEVMGHLNAGQTAAANHLLTSRDQFNLIRGRAGVGKSTMLRTAKQIIESSGFEVTVLAPTIAASRGTLRHDGIDSAQTLQRFLGDQQMQRRAAGQHIILDEASLAGMKEMLALARIADQHNIGITLLGDPRQHKAVSRGNVLCILEDFAGVKTTHVNEIVRQPGSFKGIVELLAKGKAVEAFDRLYKQGSIRQAGHGELADEYVAALDADQEVLCVCPTHIEGRQVTSALRARLKHASRIGTKDRVFRHLIDVPTTEADRRDPNRDHTGLIAKFVRNKGPFLNTQQVRVTPENQTLLRQHASAFQLFRETEIALAVGDRIRTTAGGRSVCGHRFDRSAMFTVKEISEQGEITLDNGWRLPSTFQHFDHDWVVTSFASQSRTTDTVLIAQGTQSLGASNATQFYVSLARGRAKALVFTDDLEQLRRAVAREDAKVTAHGAGFGGIIHQRSRWQDWVQQVRRSFTTLQQASIFKEPTHVDRHQPSHSR
jgi:hypothetical protein